MRPECDRKSVYSVFFRAFHGKPENVDEVINHLCGGKIHGYE